MPSPTVRVVPPTELSPYAAPAEPNWRDIDWTRFERQIDIAGSRLNYVDIGTGDETLLFVHGLSASWRWFLEQLPTFAEGRRVVAVDLPGFGASDPPIAGMSAGAAAESLEALCSTLDLGRVTVVGHSLGTMVAPVFALNHPERVERVVLSGGPLFLVANLLREPWRGFRRNPHLALGVLTEMVTVPISQPTWLAARIERPGWARRAAFKAYARYPDRLPDDLIRHLLVGLGSRGVVMPLVRDGRRNNPYAELESLSCPVLAIVGEHDRLALRADIDELIERLPRARVVVFADTGHWPQHERPASFNAELARFLDET